jgi:iron complex outermembrane recepter protein
VQFPVVYIASGGHNDNSSKAMFSQATYKLTSNVDVTAGLRYTMDQTLYTPNSYIISSPLPYAAFYAPGVTLTPPLVQPVSTARNRTDKLSPEVNLAYHWTLDVMTYVNFSQGYKSGGFTQRVFPPENTVPVFGPENATVYEVGAKSTFLDHRLRLNAALRMIPGVLIRPTRKLQP